MTTKLTCPLAVAALVAFGVPALADALPPDTSCVLAKPMDASTEPRGRGEKQPLPKGVLVVTGPTEAGWTQITAGSKGEFSGYANAKALAKVCNPVGRR